MIGTSRRTTTHAVVGFFIVVGLSACGSSDPVADFVADARDVLPEADTAEVDDNSLIFAGKAICSVQDQARADPAAFGSADFVEVALDKCEALASANPVVVPPADGENGAGGDTAGLTERGALPAQVGQRIEAWGPPMAAGVGQYFTITDIRPVRSCSGQGVGDRGQLEPVKPTNGRFMAVDLKIENTKDFDAAQAGYYPGGSQQYDFVAEDGTALDQVDTTDAFYCTGKEAPFSELKPGRNYTGTKYVDVSKSAGWLIFGQTPNGGSGYEYRIPPE